MKAQLWSLDFAASVVIFFFAVGLLIFFFNHYVSQSYEQSEFIEMQEIAIKTSDALVRFPGIPSDWGANNVTTLGLASQENVLDSGKLTAFISMDVEKARTLLVGPYQFYFELSYLNDTIAQVNGTNATIGALPTAANVTVPITRYVIYENQFAQAQLIVWR